MEPLVQQLPLAVLQHILTYADEDFVTSVYPRRPQLPTQLFSTLRAVGGAWKPSIDELQREFEATVANIELSLGLLQSTDQQNTVTAWLVAQLTLHNVQVQCLELGLEMLEFRRNFDVIPARTFADAFDLISIDWTQIFSLCPKLQRLDLSALPLRSPHLLRILEAASVHCLELKSLTLPGKEWYRGPIGVETRPLFESLYEALDCWHRADHGGLRQLTVPQRISFADDPTVLRASSDEFLYAVATSCPQLEYLDGWRASLRECDGMLRCDERIDCSPEMFELFCRSCTKLREINWFVFPFTDVYFEVFSTYPKPQLSCLTLASNTESSISRHASSSLVQRPSGCHAESVHHSLTACPALKELTVILPDDMTEVDTERPIENYVNDGLLKTIAMSCTGLTRLEIRHVDTYGAGGSLAAQDPEGGITDEGCAVLAALPSLRQFRVTVGSHIGANGLFALIENAPITGAARHIDALVGAHDLALPYRLRESLWPASSSSSTSVIRTGPSLSFHTALLGLMERMIVDHARLEGRRFRLDVHNGSSLYIDDKGLWQEQLEACATRLEAMCSELSLQIVRRGGITTATLSQSGRETQRSFVGVHTRRPKQKDDEGSSLPWKTLAWCATVNALAIGAAVKACSTLQIA